MKLAFAPKGKKKSGAPAKGQHVLGFEGRGLKKEFAYDTIP